jgi:hypothetical protein
MQVINPEKIDNLSQMGKKKKESFLGSPFVYVALAFTI